MKGLEKLQINKKYTYKELCEFFGEERKSSNSKTSQLNKWKSFFRWSNPTTQKYLIEEIYAIPLDVIDGRHSNGGNSTSKYLKLDDIIMEHFNEFDEVSTTIPKFAVEIGLLTTQYDTHRHNTSELCSLNNIPQVIADTLVICINNCVLSAIRSSLNRLHNSGHLCVHSYITLVLNYKGKIDLSEEETNRIVEIENSIEKDMGLNRLQIMSLKQSGEFHKRVKEKIFDEFGYDVRYYYRKYNIKKLTADYVAKSKEDIWRLSRKFIITIAVNMLHLVCELEDGDEWTQTELIKVIIVLINYFFSYMNHDSWNSYWKEGELDWDKDEKTVLFGLQYCLVEAFDYNDYRKKEEREKRIYEDKINQKRIESRKKAIDSLGEEEVLECEYILPSLEWSRVLEDEKYAYCMGNAIKEYHDFKYWMHYSKEELIEEYGLYVARLFANGKEDEQVPFYLFDVSMLDN